MEEDQKKKKHPSLSDGTLWSVADAVSVVYDTLYEIKMIDSWVPTRIGIYESPQHP